MTGTFTSPFGPIKDLYYGNAAQFTRESPKLNSKFNKTILVDSTTGDGLTPNQFFELSGKVHHVLVSKYGVKYDDVVGVYARNSIYIPSVHHGILSCGGIVATIGVINGKDEVYEYILKTSQAQVLVTDNMTKEAATQAVEMTGATVRVVLIEDLVKEAESAGTIETPVELSGNKAVTKDAYYFFSSGTSGKPKCVQLTHHNVTANTQQSLQAAGNFYGSDQVFGGLVPMSHVSGTALFVFTVLHDAELTVVFPEFDFELLLQSIAKYQISRLHLLPPVLLLLAKSPLVDKYPAVKDHLQRVISFAAPLSKSLIQAVELRLNIEICQVYGLTEASPLSHVFDYDLQRYDKGSVGWLVPGEEARIVNADGDNVGVGQQGELYLRGPNVMKGYLRDEKATNEAFAQDGWLKTGDIVVADETEQFYIVDRAKDVIKSGRFSAAVIPAELEGKLLKHPSVADCAVTGVISESEACELPRAFVVIKGECTPLEVKQWFDRDVVEHKRLRGGVVQVDVIPKSPTGKILRRVLRDRKGDLVHGMEGPM